MPNLRPLDGYPDAFGDHVGSVFPHNGPASYEPIETVSPPGVVITGGDLVEAVEAGFKLFDYVVGGISDDGLYYVRALPVNQSDYQPGASSTTYRLVWSNLAGTEVSAETDLSTSTVRLFAVGPK